MSFAKLDPSSVKFPPLEQSDASGLVAVGGGLSPQWLLEAYRKGIFPWYEENSPILWWCPDPRLVIIPDKLHISRSFRKQLRKHTYRLHINRDFTAVIRHCAQRQDGSAGTWITRRMAAAYTRLHQLGYAHSVEVRKGDALVGGLYGVALGKVFFGESMFSLETGTSKIALTCLVSLLRKWDFALVDCQVYSDHLHSLGAENVPRSEFIDIVSRTATDDQALIWPYDQEVTGLEQELIVQIPKADHEQP